MLDNLISSEQFRFRREHTTTTMRLGSVVTHLFDAANKKESRFAVLLDVSKAFDGVWYEGLLFRLAYLPHSSHHCGPTSPIAPPSGLSSTGPVAAGVPQGSVPVSYTHLDVYKRQV